MIGYNTAFYDEDTKHWYCDKVNSQAVTCYIKFIKKHYDYIQPLCSHADLLDTVNNKEQILPLDHINDKKNTITDSKSFFHQL